jgi:arylsulfatase A
MTRSPGRPITRRTLLRGSAGIAAAAFAAPVCRAARAAGKPNFVFILIDDMGWRDSGCYGSRFFETPNIDRLAGQGMRFTNAYAAAGVCSPTRASIMTGKYPARLGLTAVIQDPSCLPRYKLCPPEFLRALPLDEVTIATALRRAGYATACVGKWHLGDAPHLPENHGFEVNIGGSGIGMVNDHFFPGWAQPLKRPLTARGVVALDGQPGDYLADRLTDEALKFIETRKTDPFFLYLSHYAVHTPIQGMQLLVEKYRRKAKPEDPQRNPIYAAMVESVDQSVGRVLAKLDELGIAGRTIVVFTSDNGGLERRQPPSPPDEPPPTSNLPLRAGKQTLYEGGIREPLIVRWPGVVKPGSTCHVPVISNDFYPTLLDMAAVKPDPSRAVDGVSLTGLLKGGRKLGRDAIYWHSPHYGGPSRPGAAIRQGDYKLIEFFEPARIELYNLSEDIGEQNDLAAKMPGKAEELRRKLHTWQKSVGARMMTPNPGYTPPAPK